MINTQNTAHNWILQINFITIIISLFLPQYLLPPLCPPIAIPQLATTVISRTTMMIIVMLMMMAIFMTKIIASTIWILLMLPLHLPILSHSQIKTPIKALKIPMIILTLLTIQPNRIELVIIMVMMMTYSLGKTRWFYYWTSHYCNRHCVWSRRRRGWWWWWQWQYITVQQLDGEVRFSALHTE